MDRKTDRQYSLLIVSAAEQFNTLVKRVLPRAQFDVIDIMKSISQAQRQLLVRSYDIVVINTPLPDDMGVEFSIDVATRMSAGILLVTPGEIADDVAEHVIDYGIIAVSKPINGRTISQCIRHLVADRNKILELEKKLSTTEDKLREQRIINKAKWYLIANENMTEEEAHSYIVKESMNRCISKKILAEEIIDKWGD